MKYEFRTLSFVIPQIKNGKDRVRYFETYGEAYDDYNDLKKDKRFYMVYLEESNWETILQTNKTIKGVKK